MNGYIAILLGQKKEIMADSLYEAKQKAIVAFDIPPRGTKVDRLVVMLAEKNGEQVTHSTGGL
ncbi:hypothetical protein J2J97_32025 (plasmid) [Rhizobium bangladeshense]|uniref:hypothetical protein n=1 Tax=Rhizobium bangladeshense TaxID=1138189 RepID=UPI001A9933F2|nr:hypothetical protein [Rhizobium bangladeshense]QSY98535.1 hypothetical protein J2J97_32025 [Rhizobium bangladeshense]